jgi:hypothetical protein
MSGVVTQVALAAAGKPNLDALNPGGYTRPSHTGEIRRVIRSAGIM